MVKLVGIYISVPLYTIGVIVLGASITAGVFVFHVAVVPLLFKYSKTFRRGLVFANFVQWPLAVNFKDPSASGVDGGRNLYVEYYSTVDKCQIKLGIWHILPKSTAERLKSSFEHADEEDLKSTLDKELANSQTPIILYCHGNSNSRAATHRIELYKFFQNMDFHTIAFDYRGYGDSTNVRPTEDGVVEDALIVYDWLYSILEKGSKPAVFVWGHSLGTGIGSHLLGALPRLSARLPRPLPAPRGLVLEAPFNNLADEVAQHPLSKLVTWLPYYDNAFVAPFRGGAGGGEAQAFLSDTHLRNVPSLPVLILHAKDDLVVPFVVGRKLYTTILESRSQGGATVTLHAYSKELNLGHKWICHANDLPDVVGQFVSNHS